MIRGSLFQKIKQTRHPADLEFVVVTIVIFYFTVVGAQKQRKASLILLRACQWNESDFCCPVHSVFDIAFLNVKRKFISPQKFTSLSPNCLLARFVLSNCVQMFLRVSVNYCTSKTTLIP